MLAVCLNSCVSVQKNMMSKRETAELDVIGHVSTKYTSYQPIHLRINAEEKAYNKLLKIAQAQYVSEDIDVSDIDLVNMRAKGGFSGYQVPLYISYLYLGFGLVLGNIQRVTASADVILSSSADKMRVTSYTPSVSPSSSTPSKGLDKAVKKISAVLIATIPKDSKIAVINVNASDKTSSALTISEVEFHLVSAKSFTIVDRQTLDVIRQEQNFQMSGDVNDASVVAIGELSGATVVITGEIVGVGKKNRLSLKALDVKTGQIIAMGRETY